MPTSNDHLFTTLADLVDLGTRVKGVTDSAIKSASIANGVISLFRTADGSGTAAFTLNLPDEAFLDQQNSAFVPSFAWSAATYPGSTDPNLDGKPVLVLALKTQPTGGGAAVISYQFIDISCFK